MLALLLPLLQPLLDTIDRFIPDPAAASKAKADAMAQMMSILTAADAAQSDVNKTEAASTSMFVAGWRPGIGWICGGGLLTDYIVGPYFTFIAGLCGSKIVFPTIDLSTLMPLLLGMLGLGAMRSYEKVNGVPDSNIVSKKK